MAIRITGINLPDQKHIAIALTEIYGIGRPLSLEILTELKINPQTKTRDLTAAEEQRLRDYIEDHVKVEGELRRDVASHIKHHKDINSYVGQRHTRHLPVRGQRTKTNSRTVRGNVRKTAGSGKKKLDKT
jgi:small subunit ribosomal protein S13